MITDINIVLVMMFAKMEINKDNVVHKVRKQILFLTMDDFFILYYTECDTHLAKVGEITGKTRVLPSGYMNN